MLLEVLNVRQVPGESRRRWFFSHEMDLMVWFDADDNPTAFQLCYGKYHNERAIRWKTGRGFAHYRVDHGTSEHGRIGGGTPFLIAGGVFEAPRVLQKFGELSDRVPAFIREFVSARLREHAEYEGRAARSTGWPRPGIAYVAIGFIAVTVALIWPRNRKARSK